MWIFGGIYYRIDKAEIDYVSNRMAISYIGYTNSNLNNPIKMHTYITDIKTFKDITDLEAIVAKHQVESRRNAD